MPHSAVSRNGVIPALLIFSLLVAALMVHLARQSPWLGITLNLDDDQHIRVVEVATNGPSAGQLIPGDVINALLVSKPDAPENTTLISLGPEDLLEEPDALPTYAAIGRFLARQSLLAQALNSPVTVRITRNGGPYTLQLTPTARPWQALPAVFWVQLISGMLAVWIGVLLWASRPQDWGIRWFAFAGVALPISSYPTALYGSRELALDGTIFRILSATNHAGSMLFSIGIINLMLCYPQRLVRARHLVWVPLAFSLFWGADISQMSNSRPFFMDVALILAVVLVLAFTTWQWKRSAEQPLNRTALRWLLLSTFAGTAVYALTLVSKTFLDFLDVHAQGYSFGLFTLVYANMAVGLLRTALHRLDEWLFRLIYWLSGVLTTVLLIALFAPFLNTSPWLVFGLMLLAGGWLYFPVRDWMWQRHAHHHPKETIRLLPELVQIAFTRSHTAKDMLWQSLLHTLYDPREILPMTHSAIDHVAIEADGEALHIPARAGLTARLLKHPRQGTMLFTPRETVFVETLLQLMQQAEAGLSAHELGATAERRRIARDMHDDITARLLMLLHRAATPRDAELARAAIQDLRTTLNALDAQPMPLAEALAEWQAELRERCTAARVAFDWRAPESNGLLSAHEKATLERVLREAVTNALKHAAPSRIDITLDYSPPLIQARVSNDGAAPSPDRWKDGRGLRNLRKRLSEHGGDLELEPRPNGGARLTLRLQIKG